MMLTPVNLPTRPPVADDFSRIGTATWQLRDGTTSTDELHVDQIAQRVTGSLDDAIAAARLLHAHDSLASGPIGVGVFAAEQGTFLLADIVSVRSQERQQNKLMTLISFPTFIADKRFPNEIGVTVNDETSALQAIVQGDQVVRPGVRVDYSPPA